MANELQEHIQTIGHRRSSTWVFRTTRIFVRQVVFRYLKLELLGNVDALALPAPIIVAPVHRSNLDAPLMGSVGPRRIRFLAKESLFDNTLVAWYFGALGSFPVKRGEADREALKATLELLQGGEDVLAFAEGTRQSGDEVQEVFRGPGYLASKVQAKVVPVGIAGSEQALGKGANFPKREKVVINIGDPMDPPQAVNGRPDRDDLKRFTTELRTNLQALMDEAVAVRTGDRER